MPIFAVFLSIHDHAFIHNHRPAAAGRQTLSGNWTPVVIAGFIACNPFELIENVINNNKQIKAVKQAFDRLDLAGAAA